MVEKSIDLCTEQYKNHFNDANMAKIKFVEITNENLELACKIQNTIFPEENARANYIDQINNNSGKKELVYYIVFLDSIPIGVTGIYSYYEYPDDAWLGWFGILEEYRKNGYGGMVLDKTMELAKKEGYKFFRLYTDVDAKSAHKLYESRGMIKEIYDNENDKLEDYTNDIYIYSVGLTEEKIDLWNDKMLGLKEQEKKQKLYKSYNKYNNN